MSAAERRALSDLSGYDITKGRDGSLVATSRAGHRRDGERIVLRGADHTALVADRIDQYARELEELRAVLALPVVHY